MTAMRDPHALLPLTPAVFHVLMALAEDDLHGYAIMKAVAARSGGAVSLSTGSLFGIIQRMLAEGIVAECRGAAAASIRDRRRRFYRLTAFGREVARAEAERMADLVARARAMRILPRTT